ncbi:MAG: NUDIX domain-containing protein [Hydrogenophilaceae bacterium]|jgi:8-oxo-dGTP pyrophosphatase MutT (NUDIX family)|nr:NUDIX domain-containing protein [Hydrogenophilaceae bacterium]
MAIDRDDAPFDPKDPSLPRRAPRPRHAATLILVRNGKVLMGQRSKGHVFMPDKWVFPGGRVDPADRMAPALSELAAETEALIRKGAKRSPRAFALAAVRETFEEAGLVVGRKSKTQVKAPQAWAHYCACGAAPELAKLAFIARAITPPYRPRRFDAHFFMANADDVLLDDRPIGGGEELLHTEWFALDDALALDLPNVTRFVLGEVRARLAGEALAPPFLRWTRSGHRMDRL